MPITTKPAPHDAAAWLTHHELPRLVFDDESLLKFSCPTEYAKFNGLLIASSFGDVDEESPIYSYENGFVQGAVEAYNRHYHLVIRPEDVWFAILTQLTFYINAHAEELRGKFVAHDGQKQLVTFQMATLRSADYGKLAYDMSHMIQKNVVDPELREWIMPAFSTTKKEDEVVASVIMMGAMQEYFKYKFSLLCGLPSVTLLGECSDWENMLERLEKLPSFGKESGLWYTLLKPVISRFVHTFKAPNSSATKDFWQKIAHRSGGGSGPTYLSGWITAFCFWNEKGKPLYEPEINPPRVSMEMPSRGAITPVLALDEIKYHRVDTKDVPCGWVSVPVEVDDNGKVHETRMVAGSVGIKVTSSKKVLDTVQPKSGWLIFESKSKRELEQEEEAWRFNHGL